ncbi:G-protein coupled receptor [Branchiostoma belcheri]|nr:G-protein coupled receptor [Branchiostoma belcheri]
MNGTNNTKTNETEKWNTFIYDDSITALLIVAYGLVFLLCIIGNSVVCAVVIRTPRLRTVTNYFILNLAVSDLLVGIFCLPFTLIFHILNEYQFNDAMCKLTPFVQGVSVAASVFTFLMIAFDRYKAIVFPTEPRMTLKAMRKTLVGVWLCAVAISIPQIVVFNMRQHKITGYEPLNVCFEQWPDAVYGQTYTIMLLTVVYIVPLLSVLYLYGRIFHRMMLKPGPTARGNLAASKNKCTGAVSKKRVRVIKMLITVVVMFAVSWLPLYTVWMLLDFALSTYEKECGKVKHTALPADQPPAVVALHNCVSPKGYEMGMGTTLRSGKSTGDLLLLMLDSRVVNMPKMGKDVCCHAGRWMADDCKERRQEKALI